MILNNALFPTLPIPIYNYINTIFYDAFNAFNIFLTANTLKLCWNKMEINNATI